MNPQLLLASRSPRRQQLLIQLGLQVAVHPADVPELVCQGEAPADYAARVAYEKARAVQQQTQTPLPVLGADTDVVLDGKILGKPTSRAHGVQMLLDLSARAHQVVSAVAVVHGARVARALSVTDVWFAEISRAQAQSYWDSGEPQDKAGGYAIQGLGAVFVHKIAGSYSGVVGLPLHETAALLRGFDLDVLAGAVRA